MDPKKLDALMRAQQKAAGSQRSLLVNDDDRRSSADVGPAPLPAGGRLRQASFGWALDDEPLRDGDLVEFYLSPPHGWVRGRWEAASGAVWFDVTDPLQPALVVGQAQLAPPEGASGRRYRPGQLPRG